MSPTLGGGHGDIKPRGDFPQSEHAAWPKPGVTRLQTVVGSDFSDHRTVEALALAGDHTLTIEKVCNLAFSVVIRKPIDLFDDCVWRLAQHPC